ncbi:MAG: hypothetical protein DRP42_01270 [Tenericutes bacterium]|nr:MAG: hypothetical protein DRP42_01270 [Mycoplasmatota bacterium]
MKAYDIKEESPLYSVKRAQYKTLRLEPYTVLYAKTTAKIHSPEYQKVVNNLLSDAKDLQILHKSIEANFKMPPLEISVYKDKREYEFRMPIPNITAQKLREHMNLLNSRTEVRTIDLG